MPNLLNGLFWVTDMLDEVIDNVCCRFSRMLHGAVIVLQTI